MTASGGLAVAVLAMLGLVLSSSARTQETTQITFRLKSNYEYKVQVKFWSKTRNGVWPGHGQAYNLDDSGVHGFRLNCIEGEKICYGGWVTGNGDLYWGVGSDGRRGCES